MRTALVFTVFICCAASTVANSITSASSSVGSGFSAISVTDSETGGQLANSIATATFADGSVASCVFSASGFCSSAALTILLPGGSTSGGAWMVMNKSGSNMASLSIDLTGSHSAFNPCVTTGTVSVSPSPCSGGSGGLGLSVSSDSSNLYDASASTASAMVAYTNAVKLGAATSNDLFAQLMLTFSGSFGQGKTFTFLTDTDLLNSGTITTLAAPLVSNPEPATMGLVGFALVGLAFLQRHRKRTE